MNLVDPLLHFSSILANVHLELDTHVVGPTRRVPSRRQGFVEGVRIAGSNGLAIALVLHDDQFVVVHVKIAGAMKTHPDVIPNIGNKSSTRNLGVDPVPATSIPDVPDTTSVAALGAEHVTSAPDELKGIKLKRLRCAGVGSHFQPEIEDEILGGIIYPELAPPQGVCVSAAAHPEVAAGSVA